jgi:hypothetical protein
MQDYISVRLKVRRYAGQRLHVAPDANAGDEQV